MPLLLLLQIDPSSPEYQAGQAFGRMIAPCCCLGFVLMVLGALAGGGYWLYRRSQRTAAPGPGASGGPAMGSAYQFAPGQQPDFAGMQAAQRAMLAAVPEDLGPETNAINDAAKKLVHKDFDGAIAAYEAIAQRWPHRAGDAHGQIGAAWFFKGDYDRALEHYRRALALGADARMMDDNIREAEEAKRQRGH